MLVAIVAAVFVGCSKDATSDIENVISGNTVTVKFNASVEDTRATLEPNDGETAFAAAWEDGDQIGIYAYALDNNAEEYKTTNVRGSRTGNEFEATFTDAPAEIASAEYCAYYPYTSPTGNLTNIPFGSERTQIGNNYNSAYDIMISDKVAVDNASAIGKDADGNAIVFPMKRQTAIAYFHFTTDDENIKEEKIISAKLTVAGNDNIAAETINISHKTDGTISLGAKTGASKNITITFDGEVKAGDFTAWFNVLPCTFDSMTLELETENYTATISRNAGAMYEAGKLYKVSGKLTKWEPKTEDYSGTYLILAKVNNGNYWYLTPTTDQSYQIAADSEMSELGDFSTIATDGNAWKIDRNGNNYIISSLSLANKDIAKRFLKPEAANNANLFEESEAGKVEITQNENGTYSIKSTDLTDARWLALNASANPKRFVFYKATSTGTIKDLVLIPYVSTPKITPSVASVTVSPVAGSYEDITYTVSGFEMTPVVTATCDGAIVTAVEDADGTIKYTVSENSTGAERTGTITLSADGAESITINVIQQSNILAAPMNLSATGTTETITAKWNAVTNATSYGWELYKGTDKETGTLVQNGTYIPDDLTAATVTLTISGTFAEGVQYVLYVKSAAEAPFVESSFAESEAFEIKAASAEKRTKLTNTNIVSVYNSSKTGYRDIELTDDNKFTYKAYAICNQHSNATSNYKFLQIKGGTEYYIELPNLDSSIKKITMTVSGASQAIDKGGCTATLYFSSDKNTANAVASASGASSITIDMPNNNLTHGYILASGAVRIWDIEIVY